jgi:hypothetical protein
MDTRELADLVIRRLDDVLEHIDRALSAVAEENAILAIPTTRSEDCGDGLDRPS